MDPPTNEGIPLGMINPWFLHSNSTSHTSVLSAIAELIDNAYDPDVSAEQLWIDKTKIDDQDCIIFMDNGKGMDYKKLYKMLSFGFSIKQTEGQTQSHVPVGQYGNGFKSGSMRLGKDVIVFSKKDDIMCVGLLSQTYLEMKEFVVVPIVELSKTGQTIHPKQEHADSLHAILQHSLFNTKEKLLSEFDVIDRFCNSSGTRIIIWNLRRTLSGDLEFDVMKDRYDIQISDDDVCRTRETLKRQAKGDIPVPESEYSLRAYCSILYLKPRMQIILQGQKVDSVQVKDTLAAENTVTYQPVCDPHLKTAITITFGFNTKTKDHYGLMMYHKNRLIKAYERVGCQLRADNRGEGVIGVMECNHLKPTHNKQDFVYSDEYRKTITNVGKKLDDYWKNYHYAFKANRNVPEATKRPNQNRVQCNDCKKWRNLPDGIDLKKLPEKWFCHMNHDPQFRSCEAEEEPEDPVDAHPVGRLPRQLKKSKPQDNKQEKKVPQGKRQKPVAVSVHPFTSSSIQMTPQTSDDTSADKQNVILAPTCKRNEKDLYLDQENPVKKKARTEDFVQCEEEEEEEEENNRSISTQNSHSTDHSGGTQEVFISDTVKHCAADRGEYSFQCSDAGQFQCKVTNLIFEMKASGNVIYKVLSWETSQLELIGQFKPAGPLYKITSLQSSSFDLLLPHSEINTENNQSGLAVARFSGGNPQILHDLKITNTHVTLDVHGPSIFGLIKKSSGGKRINAQVLLLYKETIGTKKGKKLYIHLLPGNVSVKEVQKQHPGNTYIMCSKCQLTTGKKYRLQCEPCESQPQVETFNCDYDPNHHPIFEVILNTEYEDFKFTLLNEFNQTVWETLQNFPTGAEFVN